MPVHYDRRPIGHLRFTLPSPDALVNVSIAYLFNSVEVQVELAWFFKAHAKRFGLSG
jgi:hypothetical protein